MNSNICDVSRFFCVLKKKSGISTVVATVLIVLVTVAMVTLLWAGIASLLEVDVSSLDTSVVVLTDSGYTFYDAGNGRVFVQVGVEGSVAPEYVQLIVTSSDGGELLSVHEAPELHGKRRYLLDVSEFVCESGYPVSVAVAPLFDVDGSGVLGERSFDVVLAVRLEDVSYYDGFTALLAHTSHVMFIDSLKFAGVSGEICGIDSGDVACEYAWFPDSDGDGFGDSHVLPTVSCDGAPAPGYILLEHSDCDDTPVSGFGVNPDATEVCSDGIDNDCDGFVDDLDVACNVASQAALRGFLVGAPTLGSGRVYFVSSEDVTRGPDVPVDSISVVFDGVAVGDRFGASVSFVGDVNGDGYGDYIVGAPFADGGGLNRGKVYVYFGDAEGELHLGGSFVGSVDSDLAGNPVAGIGDFNGDGLGDFAVGALTYGDNAGKVYVVLGHAGSWESDVSLASSSDMSFVGSVGEYAGWSLAGGGDVNSDGFDDLLVGAPLNDEFSDGDGLATDSGMVYVLFGSDSGYSRDMSLVSASGARFYGQSANNYAGVAVSIIGDVNSDGFSDFAVGAPYNSFAGSKAGRVYVVFGKSDGWGSESVNLLGSSVIFSGVGANDNAGTSVAGIGDVNFDGFSDFAIGAAWNDDAGTNRGQAYVVFGGSSFENVSLSEVGVSFVGEVDNGLAGNPVAGIGDIDGDGFDDFVIGSFKNDDGGADSGKVYVVLGHDGVWGSKVSLSEADSSFVGSVPGENVGWSFGRENGGFEKFILY